MLCVQPVVRPNVERNVSLCLLYLVEERTLSIGIVLGALVVALLSMCLL